MKVLLFNSNWRNFPSYYNARDENRHHEYVEDTIRSGLNYLNKQNIIQLEERIPRHIYYKQSLFNAFRDGTGCMNYKYLDGEMPKQMTFDEIFEREKRILKKIKEKYYDLVIWPNFLWELIGASESTDVTLSLFGEQKLNQTYVLDLFEEIYKYYRSNFFITYAEDGFYISDLELYILKKYDKLKLFRREATPYKVDRIFPICYGFPDELIPNKFYLKIKDVSSIIPGDHSTRIETSVHDYYREYQQSKFAFTYAKGGWDCGRHVEILFNKCVPIFLYIEKCPPDCLYYHPKELYKKTLETLVKIDHDYIKKHLDIEKLGMLQFQVEIAKQRDKCYKILNLDLYEEIQNQIFEFSLKNLTSSSIVKHMIKYI